MRQFASLAIAILAFAAANPARAQTVECTVNSANSQLTCYAPAQIKEAKAQFARHPVVPRRIVREVTGLSLTQVFLSRGILPGISKKTVFNLDFGNDFSGEPEPNGQATYVTIDELPNPYRGLHGVSLHGALGSVNGGPLTIDSWTLEENLPGRHIGLQVMTDGSKSAVLSIGRDILQRSK